MAVGGVSGGLGVHPGPQQEVAPVMDAGAPDPRAQRPLRRRRAPRWVLPTATVIGLLVVVEILTSTGVLGRAFPTVREVGQALVDQLSTELFWTRVGETLSAWIAGFLIAAVIAIPLGMLIAASTFVLRSTKLIIDFLRPIPPIAVLPLAVLIIGTGMEMKVWLVAFSALFPILFQTLYGAQDVDPVARDSSRAYGLNRLQQYWHVVLPSATPYIATGLRLAATIGLVVTIATELIVGSDGLGYQINQVRYADNTPAMYALIFVAGVIGWLISTGFSVGEERVLHWHHSHRETN